MTLQLHLVFLVLLAAVLHATWNAVLKSSGDRFLSFTFIRGTGTVLALMAVAFVPIPAKGAWIFILAGIVIHNLYYVVLLQAYRYGDLSHVYPLARGIAPLSVAVLAAVFAGEQPSIGAMAGIALVSVGIISLMFAGGSGPGQSSWKSKAVFFALLTGLFIACYTVVDGLGIRRGETALGYIVWLNIGEGIPFMVAALWTRPAEIKPFMKIHWKRTTGAGVVVVAAYGLVLYALGQGAMAHVSALRETSVLFAALIGAFMLGESFGWRRIVAAAVIVAGMVLLQVS
ncbi:MAG: EamA family transporter [Rhodospirillales bacterium]|nr:EamA family transporter [Rhodospirillales bacterium]